MNDIDLRIDVTGDLELRAFLSDRGIRWHPDAGVFNAAPPDPAQLAKIVETLRNAPPYLNVTGGAVDVILALAEYARVKRKRLIVERSLKRIKVDATNWTADDFEQVDHLDVFKFESENANDT